jgi:hypothetical protein
MNNWDKNNLSIDQQLELERIIQEYKNQIHNVKNKKTITSLFYRRLCIELVFCQRLKDVKEGKIAFVDPDPKKFFFEKTSSCNSSDSNMVTGTNIGAG